MNPLDYCKYSESGNLSPCDQYCEKTFSKRDHSTSNIGEGAWFCRGLWEHNSQKEGGCSYWKRGGTLSLEECEKECVNARFGAFGNFITGGRRQVSETRMCMEGCKQAGKTYFEWSVMFTHLRNHGYGRRAKCLHVFQLYLHLL